MKYNGMRVYYRGRKEVFIVLLVGQDIVNDKQIFTYQAFLADDVTERLWTIPQTLETVTEMLRVGTLTLKKVDE